MIDVQVINDPAAAVVALDPVRARLLSELTTPGSAATLAPRVGLARQKVNYHLRALEAHGLVHVAGERRWGGLTERLLVASAASYVVSPAALGEAATDPRRTSDHLSAGFLIALAARIVHEIGDLAAVPARPESGCPRWDWTPKSAFALLPTVPPSPKSSRPRSPRWFRAITTIQRPTAGGTAWWWWRTHCRAMPSKENSPCP